MRSGWQHALHDAIVGARKNSWVRVWGPTDLKDGLVGSVVSESSSSPSWSQLCGSSHSIFGAKPLSRTHSWCMSPPFICPAVVEVGCCGFATAYYRLRHKRWERLQLFSGLSWTAGLCDKAWLAIIKHRSMSNPTYSLSMRHDSIKPRIGIGVHYVFLLLQMIKNKYTNV